MLKIKVFSSLPKIFSDEEPNFPEYSGFSLLKNERFNFQIAVCSDCDENVSVSVCNEFSDMFNIYSVKNVPVGMACYESSDDYFIKRTSGDYPDLLMPLEKSIPVKGNTWNSFWFEFNPDSKINGKHCVEIKINQETLGVNFTVVDATIPDQTLIHTNWYHSDCLCDYYNVDAFSDEYWRINRNFIKTARDHGINCILTPLFTPPLDTWIGGERTTVQLVGVTKLGGKYLFDFRNLKKWIDICTECNIEYFEMSHLFTQWGAKHAPKIVAKDSKGRVKKIFGWSTKTTSKEYDSFLRQFAEHLNRFIKNNHLENRVYFHISDEPSVNHLKVYKKRYSIIKEIFPDYKVLDAMSDFDFYKTGSVDIPVPCENHIEDFVGNVETLWTYYCCGQCRDYVPNRFIAMPSLRNRVLGVLLYKYDVKGFLQWGYNFYNSQHSRKHINPYEITDAGNAFPSGDAFVVYPAPDGSAYCSLRLKVFYDAIQDYETLKLLESKTGREEVLKMIGDITFKEYPHDDDWLLNLRNSVNLKLQ